MRGALPSIVQPNNAPIILPCGDFSSTLIHPTSESFGVQINCPIDAIARCIAWVVNPANANEGDIETKATFWSYSNSDILAPDGVAAMIVKDVVSAEGSCQRVISFSTLPKTPGQIWNARCSNTGDTGVCTLIFNDKLRPCPMIIIEMYPIQSTVQEVRDALADAPTDQANALPPIIPISNAPIIPYCGEFSSTLTDSTTDSFSVQITCPAYAIARCIAWMVHPEAGNVVNADDLVSNANFWSYSNDDIVQQDGVLAPIIVKDDVSEEGSCQRDISFPNLLTNPKPKWDARCSYTGYPGVCIFIFNDIFAELIHIMTESLKYIELSQH